MNHMLITRVFCICILFVLIVTIPVTAESTFTQNPLVTEGKFRQTLENSLSGQWKNVELRQILHRIADDRKIAFVLDCRLDPNQQLNVEISNLSVENTFQKIASITKTSISIAANTIYVGPSSDTAKLRTLIALRTDELTKSKTNSIPKTRRLKLSQKDNFHWNDLTTPKEMMTEIAKKYNLQIEEIDLIQHDLWAGIRLPHVNAMQALSLILIQCQRTFVWTKNGSGIKIVDLPQKVVVTKTVTLRRTTAKKMTQRCQQQLPDIPITLKGTKLTVTGTMEQHDQIDVILHPERHQKKTPAATKSAPLERRLFTLKIKNVPAIALINKLKESGIKFEFDANQFKKKGIDFSQRISMDVNQAKADEFFNIIFSPLGVTCEINGITVLLKAQ